ncbi:hypothetical protein QBC41DRAFT_384016 [Cercophora samala]|uniref:Uncharacterized protein n=1 Tax=Cercophora samala TaxID=330535 RepID=A0AA40DFR0_9PEZI|nr:hypothetical protein QBC41DRAFT_384016 [Cercophora samala]
MNTPGTPEPEEQALSALEDGILRFRREHQERLDKLAVHLHRSIFKEYAEGIEDFSRLVDTVFDEAFRQLQKALVDLRSMLDEKAKARYERMRRQTANLIGFGTNLPMLESVRTTIRGEMDARFKNGIVRVNHDGATAAASGLTMTLSMNVGKCLDIHSLGSNLLTVANEVGRSPSPADPPPSRAGCAPSQAASTASPAGRPTSPATFPHSQAGSPTSQASSPPCQSIASEVAATAPQLIAQLALKLHQAPYITTRPQLKSPFVVSALTPARVRRKTKSATTPESRSDSLTAVEEGNETSPVSMEDDLPRKNASVWQGPDSCADMEPVRGDLDAITCLPLQSYRHHGESSSLKKTAKRRKT